MQLPNPVVINMGRYGDRTISNIPIIFIDDSFSKIVRVKFRLPLMKSLTVWENAEYDAAGDYTQAELESRILELLGPDIKSGLQQLFIDPENKV